MSVVGRRACLLAGLGAGLLVAVPAVGGSYLDRAALLIGQANKDSDFLHDHLSDKELAAVIHRLARARSRAASKMQVPKEVASAHPHVLLVLENHEQAAGAAVDGSTERFFVYLKRARDEERVLRDVLKQLGWTLPKY